MVFVTLTRFSPESSFLQANLSWLSQSVLIWDILQPIYYFCDSLLDELPNVHVCLVLGSPELDTALQVLIFLTNAEYRGRITSLPMMSTLTDCNGFQKTVSLLCFKAGLYSAFCPAEPIHPSLPAYFPACSGAQDYSSQEEEFTFSFVAICEIPVGRSLQPVKVSFNGITPIWRILTVLHFPLPCWRITLAHHPAHQ